MISDQSSRPINFGLLIHEFDAPDSERIAFEIEYHDKWSLALHGRNKSME